MSGGFAGGAPAPSPPLPGDPGAGAPHRVLAAAALAAALLAVAPTAAVALDAGPVVQVDGPDACPVEDRARPAAPWSFHNPPYTLTSHADTAALPGP